MLKNLSTVTVSLFFGAVATSAATLPTPSYANQASLNSKLQEIATLNRTMTQETAIPEVAPEKPKEKRLTCKGCNQNETFALNYLQDKGITDKNALATIMGNIRQESTFIPNICEGGSIVSYERCRSGGYGLIQWTDSARFNGLGNFAYNKKANPSSIETQLDYMINESDWKMIEQRMMRPGGTINDYMRLARQWIRWGEHGARTNFAYDYARRLVLTES